MLYPDVDYGSATFSMMVGSESDPYDDTFYADIDQLYDWNAIKVCDCCQISSSFLSQTDSH
jgi:hypothetical protein